MTSLTKIRKSIQENVICDDVMVSRKNGCVRVFKGYFYRSHNAEKFAQRIESACIKHNIPVRVTDCGSTWKPFRGGASVRSQSHYWVDLVPFNDDDIGG